MKQTMSADDIDSASQGQLPVQISSASSLDSFFIDLPQPYFTLQLNNSNGLGNDETDGQESTTGTSQTIPSSDSMLFNSQQATNWNLEDLSSACDQALGSDELNVTMTSALQSHRRRATAPASATNAPAVINNSVPEFLCQLTKMLTDSNTDVIEWSKGT
jgi:hypothetical protein